MAKEDSVAQGIAALQQAQADALGKCFDDGLASAPQGGGFSQADIDSAVAAAKAADQADEDTLRAQLTDALAKEATAEDKLNQIKALLG